MMQQTIEGSVLIYPRAVGGKGIFYGVTCFSWGRDEDQFHQRVKRGTVKNDRQLTADEWGRGHCIAQGLMGDQVNVFFYCFIFFLATKGSNVEA